MSKKECIKCNTLQSNNEKLFICIWAKSLPLELVFSSSVFCLRNIDKTFDKLLTSPQVIVNILNSNCRCWKKYQETIFSRYKYEFSHAWQKTLYQSFLWKKKQRLCWPAQISTAVSEFEPCWKKWDMIRRARLNAQTWESKICCMEEETKILLKVSPTLYDFTRRDSNY